MSGLRQRAAKDAAKSRPAAGERAKGEQAGGEPRERVFFVANGVVLNNTREKRKV